MITLAGIRNTITKESKGRPDLWLVALIIILSLMGLVWVYDASFVNAYTQYGDAAYYATHQLQWMLMGGVALIITMHIDYHRWRQISLPAMIVVLFLLVIVVTVHQVSPLVNNAHRWIRLGNFPVQLQPSELAKLVLIFYGAHWLSRKGDKVRTFYYGLIPFGIILGVLVGLIELEPDLGTSIVIVGVGLAMFFVAGADLFQLLFLLFFAGGAFSLLIKLFSFRTSRLGAFIDPWSDPLGSGYHIIQSLYGIGSGGVFGVGLGVSVQKYAWLPEAHTDSIFAVVAEEVGLVGSIALILVYIFVAYRGYRVALNAPDVYGALIATGVTTWIAFQAAINIAVATKLIPFTGIPLPFISYGGSSLWVMMAGCGILLNISRASERAINEEGPQKTNFRELKAWFGLPTFTRPQLGQPRLPKLTIPSVAALKDIPKVRITIPQALALFTFQEGNERETTLGKLFGGGRYEPDLEEATRAESIATSTPEPRRTRQTEPRYYTRQRDPRHGNGDQNPRR